jgi:hypothetical protein
MDELQGPRNGIRAAWRTPWTASEEPAGEWNFSSRCVPVIAGARVLLFATGAGRFSVDRLLSGKS